MLNIAVALYLFANGITGFTRERGGEFDTMVRTIFKNGDFSAVIIIVLSVCAVAAGIFLLLSLFRIYVPITDIILIVFIVVWLVFIAIVDVINPISSYGVNFLEYTRQLAAHIMVLGALISSMKRFA